MAGICAALAFLFAFAALTPLAPVRVEYASATWSSR